MPPFVARCFMAREKIAITRPLVALSFGATNIPDANGNAFASEPASAEYVMPWAGSIIGIAVGQNALLSTGSLLWNPTVDGSAKSALGATTDTTNQRASAKTNVGKIPFTAGQRLGVAWTKTGTIAATTTDAAITLYVEFDEVRA